MPKWKTVSIAKEVEEFGTKRKVSILFDEITGERVIKKEVIQTPHATKNLVDKLAREFYFLDSIKHLGLTPKPLTLNLKQDGSAGNLTMEYITGEALINHSEIPNSHQKMLFDPLVTIVAKTIQTIHDYQILIGDMNKETFLMEGLWNDNKSLSIKMIDLGYAAKPQEINNNDIGDWLSLFYKINPHFDKLIQKKNFLLSVELAKKMEYYRAMRLLLGYYLQEPWDTKIGLSFENFGKKQIRKNLEKALRNKAVFASENVLRFLSLVFSQDIFKMPENALTLSLNQKDLKLPQILSSKEQVKTF